MTQPEVVMVVMYSPVQVLVVVKQEVVVSGTSTITVSVLSPVIVLAVT